MFESDDWNFEDVLCDIDEKAVQSRSECPNDGETSSVKRRRLDSSGDSSVSPFAMVNVCDSRLTKVADIKGSEPCNSKTNPSRGDLLLGIFQDNVQSKSSLVRDMGKEQPRKNKECSLPSEKNTVLNVCQRENISMNNMESKKEVKLVRLFPGPAGLVADKKNGDVSIVSYLSNVNKLESRRASKCVNTDMPRSQSDKDWFGENAWKLLLEELPSNFFKEYGISMVKDKANASHCDSTKVQFMAGMLDYIDQSHDDPFIILKDNTGSIEGTIHRDIPLNYPDVLESNVVILLYDVGLLKTTTYVMTNKYHVLISPVSLLAIYSNKGRTVCSSHMENILSNISNIEANRGHCTAAIQKYSVTNDNVDKRLTTKEISNDTSISSRTNFTVDPSNKCPIDEMVNPENRKQTFKNDCVNRVTVSKVIQNVNCSISMHDDDLSFSTADSISLEKEKCLKNSNLFETTSQSDKAQRNEVLSRQVNHLQNTEKRPVADPGGKIKERKLAQILQKCVTEVEMRKENTNVGVTLTDTYVHTKRETNAAQSIRSPEQSFKSTSSKCNAENSKTLVKYFTRDTFCDNEFDSDDEILSQLDV